MYCKYLLRMWYSEPDFTHGSRITDHGVRMLMRMAADPGRALSTAELAEEFGLSRNLLAKILQRLAQAGIVTTQRGGSGGAVMALPPETIRLGTLVRVLEQGQALVECSPREVVNARSSDAAA